MKTDPYKYVNLNWLDSNYPCMVACPVHTDAGRYAALIEEGDYTEAYYVARRSNPFASVCGRICSAQCETACRRGKLDQPVALRALKRLASEMAGIGKSIDLEKLESAFRSTISPNGIKIAVVGAGPAGLSCAHDLALLGYSVTVFEAQSEPGGMLRLGVPDFRLPMELLNQEINAILKFGISLELNTALGRDFTLSDLKARDYKGFFVAIGAHLCREMQMEGTELEGVYNAVNFLRETKRSGGVQLGKKVIVIGGGNLAVDIARIAARQNSALTGSGREVHVYCLEDRDSMPASSSEISRAEEEGIEIHNRKGVVKIIGSGGRVSALEIIDCVSALDREGKLNPVYASGTERIIKANNVIAAIGLKSDLSWIKPGDGIEITTSDTIKIDPGTLSTSMPGVYTGGDAAFGPRFAIEAIANGKKAAQSLHSYITGENGKETLVNFREGEVELIVHQSYKYRRPRGYEGKRRVQVRSVSVDQRLEKTEVETGYDKIDGYEEASRCLHCWINTVFGINGEKTGTECILCAACVDICPENCIELISLDRLEIKEPVINGVREEFNLGSQILNEGAVMIKDEDSCIRCGLCAMRCPVGCITMQTYISAEIMPV